MPSAKRMEAESSLFLRSACFASMMQPKVSLLAFMQLHPRPAGRFGERICIAAELTSQRAVESSQETLVQRPVLSRSHHPCCGSTRLLAHSLPGLQIGDQGVPSRAAGSYPAGVPLRIHSLLRIHMLLIPHSFPVGCYCWNSAQITHARTKR